MQFLKTLFWVVVAVVAVLFAHDNWHYVRPAIKIWGGLEVDVKVPVLVLIAFLLGFLPTVIYYRTKLRALRRRAESQLPSNAGVGPAPVANPVPTPVRRSSAAGEATLAERDAPDREATDSKAWPTT
jgi:hypothetical protein